MRKAAGILMIIHGVRSIVFMGFVLSEPGIEGSTLAVGLFAIISAVFIIAGGFFCIKRKYWKLCFASSIVLLLFMIFDLLFLVHMVWLIPTWVFFPLAVPWPILPQIFVCLRRSEWQEISA